MGKASPARDSRHAPGARVRATAARVVVAVWRGGRSLDAALARQRPEGEARDRALMRELCFGTLRVFPRLQAIAHELLAKPLKSKDGDLEALIWIGLYQLLFTRIPVHAALSATVSATRVLGKPWAATLINALLRRFQRERSGILARLQDRPESRWLFPGWLLRRLQIAWPQHWEAIVRGSNERAPLWLRVNRMRMDTAAYGAHLEAVGLVGRPIPSIPQALVVDRAVPVERLPGFSEGWVSVQDGNAQRAASLLAPHPGARVLDACAAPGGKTAHLLELTENCLDLTAIDRTEERLPSIRDTLDRLGLKARVSLGDAERPSGDWANRAYDRILLDAPCSATGVIRRHPDIKWLRRDEDIPALARRQARMLRALWPLLAPGGRLLYATCSVLPEENEGVIAAFLATHPDAREIRISGKWGEWGDRGIRRTHGCQFLPQPGGGDGFYYALIQKVSP